MPASASGGSVQRGVTTAPCTWEEHGPASPKVARAASRSLHVPATATETVDERALRGARMIRGTSWLPCPGPDLTLDGRSLIEGRPAQTKIPARVMS